MVKRVKPCFLSYCSSGWHHGARVLHRPSVESGQHLWESPGSSSGRLPWFLFRETHGLGCPIGHSTGWVCVGGYVRLDVCLGRRRSWFHKCIHIIPSLPCSPFTCRIFRPTWAPQVTRAVPWRLPSTPWVPLPPASMPNSPPSPPSTPLLRWSSALESTPQSQPQVR